MSNDWFTENAGGSGAPGVYFKDIGQVVSGTIAAKPRETSFLDEKGKEQPRLIVELVAVDGCTALKGTMRDNEPIAEGDQITLWVKPGLMAAAIQEALQAADAKGLSEGDRLTVKYTEDKDTGKIQPAKVYVAKYTAAKPAVSVDELI